MRPINVINKLNEADEIEQVAESFKSQLSTALEKFNLYFVNENIISDGAGEMGIQFYTDPEYSTNDTHVPYIGLGGDTTGNTVSPKAVAGWEQENGDPHGSSSAEGQECYAMFKSLDEVSPEEVANIINKSFASDVKESVETLTEDSGKKYHYITYANNPDEIGAEYEYNSMANSEVLDILDELKAYFTQAEADAKDIIANAQHDPGVYQSDIDMCKFCAAKVQEIIDKMNATWE